MPFSRSEQNETNLKRIAMTAAKPPKPMPSVFCWSKMGTEAGQSLEAILARKDAERALGGGVFFWGIGNALGPKLWKFIGSVTNPMVFFTPMRSKPKEIDVSPKRVVAWREFIDREGKSYPIPKHVFVTSRASEEENADRAHFALVCRKASSIFDQESWGSIASQNLRNFGASTNVAFSQVTAIVQRIGLDQCPERRYEVNFAAELVSPYFVRLADPVEVPREVLREINSLGNREEIDAERWRDYLERRCSFRSGSASDQSQRFRLGSIPRQQSLPIA
jgi:hypothetical protein